MLFFSSNSFFFRRKEVVFLWFAAKLNVLWKCNCNELPWCVFCAIYSVISFLNTLMISFLRSIYGSLLVKWNFGYRHDLPLHVISIRMGDGEKENQKKNGTFHVCGGGVWQWKPYRNSVVISYWNSVVISYSYYLYNAIWAFWFCCCFCHIGKKSTGLVLVCI